MSTFKQILTLQNSILAKYLMRQVLVLFIAVFVVIGLVVFGNQLFLVIKESIKQGILIADLMSIIGFKMIRDIPLIVSLSFFLAIILAVNKLYKDSEAVVMNAIGVGDKHFMLFIQPAVIVIFLLILFLTTVAVPWSKQQRSMIMDRNENASEFAFIKEGEFQQLKQGNLVFYASEVSSNDGELTQDMENIFIYVLTKGEPIITLASTAQKYTNATTNSVYLRLKDGARYHGFPGEKDKKILNFDLYDLQIIDGSQKKNKEIITKTESKSTWDLLSSNDNKEIAEWQARLSQPLSVLILSIFAILLGKTSPRGGKNLGVLIGIAVFIIYNSMLNLAKSSLENSELSSTIGLWWVHLLVLFIIIILYAYRHGKFNHLIANISSHRYFNKE